MTELKKLFIIRRIKIFTGLLLILNGFCNPVQAQSFQSQLGSWNIINAKMNINKQWSLFIEPQLRSLSFYNQFHYYELKGGLTYKINSNFVVTTGVGSYNTYSEGGNFKMPYVQKEIRTWVQLVMNQHMEIIKLDHRYRAEQRFTTNGYRNRFRYRLNTVVPINNKKVIPKTFYAAVWNEVFFTDKVPYFERNRFFIGGGYEVNETLAFQTGYVHQFDYKISDETGRDFFQISMLLNFDLKKGKQEFMPGVSD
ncbi:MAG: DUF2490 domain-containing protein [Chitinophagaceae bacterium]|nr:DUF2490 domain-containing protein [Chitinophagaceae bacterium]